MSFLLDTDVLSATQKRKPDRRVSAWLARTRSTDLHVSALSIGEVRRGAVNLHDRGDRIQAQALENWLEEVIDALRDRILPVSLDIASAWGRQGMRRAPAPIDALIAATAIVHGLTMVTRNVRHFALTGVRIVNPYEG